MGTAKRYYFTEEEKQAIRQIQEEQEADSEYDHSAAEQEFRATLSAAGIQPELIEKLSALGPVRIISQIENGQLRFSSAERETLIEKAVNVWVRKFY